MKKKWLLLPLFLLVLIFTLLPVSFLNANPGNLVKNGDFSNGLNNWSTFGIVSVVGEAAIVGPSLGAFSSEISQYIDTTNKNLVYSCDIKPVTEDNSFEIGFNLYDNSNHDNSGFLGNSHYFYNGLSTQSWETISFKISDCYQNMIGTEIPDFVSIRIYAASWFPSAGAFDNFKLEAPGSGAEAEPVWVRTMPMTCYRVWINEDNNFQFIFWYPYRDNNWVKIYDMSGKEVFSIDMPYDNPNLIVDLPDGMYTVKTFNVDPATPIQTFVIGKP